MCITDACSGYLLDLTSIWEKTDSQGLPVEYQRQDEPTQFSTE